MRKFFLILSMSVIFTSMVSNVQAQSKFKGLFKQHSDANFKHSIGVNPLFLLQGLRVKYETPFSSKISVGGYFTAHLWSSYCNGIMLAPTARWYFSGKPADYGFYGQVKPLVGFYKIDLFDGKKSFVTGGLGLAVGYQFNFKNPKWSVDLTGGFKFVSNIPEDKEDGHDKSWEDEWNEAWDDASWRSMGAGSVFDFNVSVCYRF